MKISFIAILLSLLLGCQKEEDATITQSWTLIEVLADPGDGSGTFHPTSYQKTVTFLVNGTFQSSQSMCQMGNTNGQPGTGRVDSGAHVLVPDECPDWSLQYEYEGDFLIITYSCIEACREKYKLLATN